MSKEVVAILGGTGEQGLGLHDMNPARVHPELHQWNALWAWLESRRQYAQSTVAVGGD